MENIPNTHPCSADVFSNQIGIVRAELRNIRETQKKLDATVKKSVSEINNSISTATKNFTASNTEVDTCVTPVSEGTYAFKAISFIESCYKHKNGTPRQGIICSASRAILKLDKSFFNNPEHSLSGLEEYSHVWLLFVFHKNDDSASSVRAKVRSPRMDGKKLGVFATRSPHRPCPIGLSLVKLKKVEGDVLHLSSVDLIDGTPILDIKPYIPNYDNPLQKPVSCTTVNSVSTGASNACDFNEEPQNETSQSKNAVSVNIASWINVPKTSTLCVIFTERAERQLMLFHNKDTHEGRCEYCLDLINVSEVKSAVQNILSEDPRSIYRRNKCGDRLYYFSLDVIHVTCWFDDCESVVEVVRLKPDKSD